MFALTVAYKSFRDVRILALSQFKENLTLEGQETAAVCNEEVDVAPRHGL